MDHQYDGQIRRYITQFMRIFIGFKYKTGGSTPEEKHIPVMYGDMTRQVASVIKENSENKMLTVPRISCYVTGLEMDRDRTSDSTFVSKINIRQRRYTGSGDTLQYENVQGGGYTVERLMPTPFMLSMKADIWTSNTDQKLQLLEQILGMFNPSLEIQTNDNFVDWTSLSVVNVKNITFSSRQIPQGLESEIDVCSLEFTMPIYISPPAKVKRLGIIQTIISNVFTDAGDIVDLSSLIYEQQAADMQVVTTLADINVFLIKSASGGQYDYDLTAMLDKAIDWHTVIDITGNYSPLSQVYFKQPSGYNMVGTFTISETDPSKIIVTFDADTIPANTIIPSPVNGLAGKGTIDAIIDPVKYNPVEVYGNQSGIPVGIRYLMLGSVNDIPNVSQDYTGPIAWKNLDGSDPIIPTNSIIEWSGTKWNAVFDPTIATVPTYVQNLKTGIKYRWEGTEWLRAFEGEYVTGFWGFNLAP
jgi:hypothetical protein